MTETPKTTSSPIIAQVRPQVLADGTYATQAAVAEAPAGNAASAESTVVTLRSLIVGGDTYLGAVVCVTLVKLLLRLAGPDVENPISPQTLQKRKAECMLVMVSMLRLSEQGSSGSLLGLDRDSHDRIVTCLQMLNSPSEEVALLWMTAYRAAYSASLEEQRTRAADEADAKAAENAAQPDDPIDFAHLKHRRGVSQVQLTRLLQSHYIESVTPHEKKTEFSTHACLGAVKGILISKCGSFAQLHDMLLYSMQCNRTYWVGSMVCIS